MGRHKTSVVYNHLFLKNKNILKLPGMVPAILMD
jgi:hypothetical protein